MAVTVMEKHLEHIRTKSPSDYLQSHQTFFQVSSATHNLSKDSYIPPTQNCSFLLRVCFCKLTGDFDIFVGLPSAEIMKIIGAIHQEVPELRVLSQVCDQKATLRKIHLLNNGYVGVWM